MTPIDHPIDYLRIGYKDKPITTGVEVEGVCVNH